MAKLTASEASWFAADMCLQTHGGFGFVVDAEIGQFDDLFVGDKLFAGFADREGIKHAMVAPAMLATILLSRAWSAVGSRALAANAP